MILKKFLLLISVLSFTIWPASGSYDCSHTCGDFDIPYPFGIGSSNCSRNEWFEMTCNQSSTNSSKYVPFLRKIQLEVLNISTDDGTVIVNNPIVSSCGGHPPTEIDLTGSNFFYSSFENEFMVVGCNSSAFLTNQGGDILSGCVTRSTCTDSVKDDEVCFLSNCCPSHSQHRLTMYKVNFFQNSSNSSCSYAFLVSQDWWEESYPSDSAFYSIAENMTHVPVELEWGLESDLGNSSYPGTYTMMHPSDERKAHSFREAIIGISVGSSSMLLLVGGFFLYKGIINRRNRKLKQKFFKRNGGLLLQQQISVSPRDGKVEKSKVFTFEELQKATDHFNGNRVLGHGGQGTVYKGMLIDGRIVAVKKSKIMVESQIEQFINEVVILSQINHRNVVRILGCCLETEVPLLVYEFVPNGTLFGHIQNPTEEFPMSWGVRLRIAVEVASALAYLHSATYAAIYHRDIKSTNILLDEKYRAKVSDFGTSKSIPLDLTHLTTLVKGTFGYIDPEYFQTSQFTDKSDVYGFGVVLLELLTSQKPICWAESQEDPRSLATLFLMSMEANRLDEILDPQLMKEDKNGQLVAAAELAKVCLNLSGKNRPTMKEVAIELERIQMSPMYATILEAIQNDEQDAANKIIPFDALGNSTGTCLDHGIEIDAPKCHLSL